MANVTKINLYGVEYNLTDKEAQNLIKQLQDNTYSKTEVDSLVSAIDDKLEGIDMASYETIEGAKSKYQPKGNYLTEHQDISGLATKQEVADAVAGVDVTEQLKDYAKKSELPSVDGLISKAEADATYQPKGDYVTDHYVQDAISENRYNDSAIKADIAALKAIDHNKYLTEHQDISGKVDKVSGKGLSTNDYSNADKAKVDATPTFWVGTQAEYDAIATKDNKTFYYITE